MNSGPPRSGRSYGKAGGSLHQAHWAANAGVAQAGQNGEQRTALLLDALALKVGGPTVMHDLRIPLQGISANIDHVVISGRTVYIIDTKVWRPAFYWTVGGKTRRGLERFPHADRKTMPMAHNALSAYLRPYRAQLPTPMLVIWPSSTRAKMRTWALTVPGAQAMVGDRFESWTKRRALVKPADPNIAHALAQLLITAPGRTQPRAA